MSASASSRPRPSWSIEARSSSDAARSASSPSWMRTLTRRCWALSCRSRWMRRRSRSVASRARTRACRRSRCRAAVRTRAQTMPPSATASSRTTGAAGACRTGTARSTPREIRMLEQHHPHRAGGYCSGGHPECTEARFELPRRAHDLAPPADRRAGPHGQPGAVPRRHQKRSLASGPDGRHHTDRESPG